MDQLAAINIIELAASIRRDIETLTDDAEVVRDTLEGEIDLDGVFDYLVSQIGFDEGLIEALGMQIKQMSKRIERLKLRVDTHKSLIRKGLSLSGWNKRERPLATLSLDRKPPCLGDVDTSKVPTKFWKQPDPVLDRAALLAALKKDEIIPGATLAPTDMVLHIRRG